MNHKTWKHTISLLAAILSLGGGAAAAETFMAGSLEALSKGFADISGSDDRNFLLHDQFLRRVLIRLL